ncbi:hypothetical protein TCAL_11426, partial [Tigriopus californicus]
MDTDIITLKRMHKSFAGTNYLYFAAPGKIASAILKFHQGHPFLNQSIHRAAQTYTGKVWGEIGPLLYTSMVNASCPVFVKRRDQLSVAQSRTILHCPGYMVLPQYLGFPLRTSQRHHFYERSKNREVKNMIKKSATLHLFNSAFLKDKLPSEKEIQDLASPLMQIRRDACPIAYLSFLEANSRSSKYT